MIVWAAWVPVLACPAGRKLAGIQLHVSLELARSLQTKTF